MTVRRMILAGVAALGLAAGWGGLGGCETDAVNRKSEDTFLTADDLIQMTDQMAAAITSDWRVADIIKRTGKPMVIVMLPVGNETNEIMPAGQKRMYVHRVRVLLSSKQILRSQFTFILNKADYDALERQEGVPVDQLGTPAERLQPEYALTGTFYADTNVDSKHRSDYYLCTYRLTNLKPDGTAGEIIWEGKYETKKAVTKGFLD